MPLNSFKFEDIFYLHILQSTVMRVSFFPFLYICCSHKNMFRKRIKLFKLKFRVVVDKKPVYKTVKEAIYSEIQIRVVVQQSTKRNGRAVNIYLERKNNPISKKLFCYNAIFFSQCTLNLSYKVEFECGTSKIYFFIVKIRQ